MTAWHRMSYPPRAWFVVFVIAVVLTDLLAGALWLSFSKVLVEFQLKRFDLAIGLFSIVLCIVAAIALGVFRAMRCPLRDSGYQEWLAASPWEGCEKTPFGPCAPHRLDCVPLGVLGLICVSHALVFGYSELTTIILWGSWNGRLAILLSIALMPTFAFLGVWVLSITSAMLQWRAWVGILQSWWVAVIVHTGVWLGKEICLAAIVVSVPVLAVPYLFWLQRALRELPGKSLAMPVAGSRGPGLMNDMGMAKKLSPENQCLSPSGYEPMIVRYFRENRTSAISNILLLGACAGWFPWEKSAIPGLWMLLMILAMVRLLIHIDRLHSPLSLPARWATRRWIIPAYDVVFLPSMLMIVVGGLLLQLGAWGLLPMWLAVPLSVSAACLMGFLSGRRYVEWSLTAPVAYDVRQVRK